MLGSREINALSACRSGCDEEFMLAAIANCDQTLTCSNQSSMVLMMLLDGPTRLYGPCCAAIWGGTCAEIGLDALCWLMTLISPMILDSCLSRLVW